MKRSLSKDAVRLCLLVFALVLVLLSGSFFRVPPAQKAADEISPYLQMVEAFNAASGDLKIAFNQEEGFLLRDRLLSIDPDEFAGLLQAKAQAYCAANLPEREPASSVLGPKRETDFTVYNLPKYFDQPLVVPLKALLTWEGEE